MKHYPFPFLILLKKIFFLFFIYPLALSAQTDTTLKDYFPMKIGNYWEYLSEGTPEPEFHYKVRVIGDTTFSNGKSYKIFFTEFIRPQSTPDYKFYRIDDSLNIYEHSTDPDCSEGEYIIFKLGTKDKTIWPICLDIIPEGQDYLGLDITYEVYYPSLMLDTTTKFYRGVIIETNGDTIWGGGIIYGYSDIWLAKGLGKVKVQGEAGPPIHLIGAVINGIQYGYITDIKDIYNTPKIFELHQNFPNPFNPITRINFNISEFSYVQLNVYDLLGGEVAVLIKEEMRPGSYSINFNATDLSSSFYFYKLIVNDKFKIRKMLLIK